jgi:molybdopterin converting factor small subunit
VAIRLPGPLRALADGRDEVAVPAATVGEALDRLAERHPGLRRHLRADGGGLREHVNVFLNDDDVRHLRGEATPIAAEDVITVVASIAGG